MNILIANDDGINAQGIHALADALAQIDDVNLYIIAPDKERSCCGHGLTLDAPVNLVKHDSKEFNEKVKWAYACSGIPSDCVRIGMFLLQKEGIPADLVCTGINHGPNLGSDIYYSGTLAAAREASVCFTQSIAFSLCNSKPTHFEHFKAMVPKIVESAYKKLPYTTILNVNIPDLPIEEIKGTVVCKQGPMDYSLEYQIVSSNEDEMTLLMEGDENCDNYDDYSWDSVLGREGYITLTPVDLMPYNEQSLQSVRNLHINLNE